MEALDTLGELGQLRSRHTEAGAWGTGVIQVGLHRRVLGVDTQPERHAPIGRHQRAHLLDLTQRIEGHVRAVAKDGGELLTSVGWAEGMCLSAHLLVGQLGFVDRACRAMRDVLADNREGLPERIGLESQDDLHARPLSYVADEGKVPPKQVFLEDVAGGREGGLIHRCQYLCYVYNICKVQR